jgi:hypothetical protein
MTARHQRRKLPAHYAAVLSPLVLSLPTLLLVLPVMRRIVGALCEPAGR